jgi:hypothetical protein
MFGDGLFRDLEWLGQLVDRLGIGAQAGDDPPSYRVGKRHERFVETLVCPWIHDHLSTISFINQPVDYDTSPCRGCQCFETD